MKARKSNFTFLIKVVVIILFIGGLLSLYLMKPIHVKSVMETTSLAEKSRGILYKTEDVYVCRTSVFSGEDFKKYVILVKGNNLERTLVETDRDNKKDDFIKVMGGLISEDKYVLNPPLKMQRKAKGIVDWRFDY